VPEGLIRESKLLAKGINHLIPFAVIIDLNVCYEKGFDMHFFTVLFYMGQRS
jgi:hypothetical protein